MKVSARLDDRFRAAALADGLLDVAYELSDTPLGTLLLAKTDRVRPRTGSRGGGTGPSVRAPRAAHSACARQREAAA